ncbi:MAG: hypothetical protein RLZZ479_905 [Bacteroidota bacterium]|jgi:hypothetical protein
MNCIICNFNKETRDFYKNKLCPLCYDTGTISFHKYVRYRLDSEVIRLNNGKKATLNEDTIKYVVRQYETVIYDCYQNLNKKVNRKIESFNGSCTSPDEVAYFYINQFV